MNEETSKKMKKNYASWTGNFIIAGDPKFIHFDKKGKRGEFYIINFSIFWKPMIRGKDFDEIEASFAKASIITDAEKIDEVRETIKRKARIYISEGIPMLKKWKSKKDDTERSEIQIRVYEYYPYFLDKDLNPIDDDKPNNNSSKIKTESNEDKEYTGIDESEIEEKTEDTKVESIIEDSADDTNVDDYL